MSIIKLGIIRIIRALIIVFGSAAIIGFLFVANIFGDIRNSHISGNIPETREELQQIIQRGLEIFFKHRYGEDSTVRYELLRTAPTQAGMSYPSFYAWVEVMKDNRKIDSGAVNMAVIDKKEIAIRHFLANDRIKENPEILSPGFPAALHEAVLRKANTE